MSKRESHTPAVSTLYDTLGEESCGVVFLDPAGIPMKYDQLEIYKDAVGTAECRIAVDVPNKDSWQTSGLVVNTKDMDDAWKQDISQGATHLLETTKIGANDPHLDAKLWVHMHPYGTGSLLSEVHSGGAHRMVKNRLLLVQSCFRQNNLYAFWYSNRIITKELFYSNWNHRNRGVKSASDEKSTDNITRLYGTVMPASIPESTA